MLHEYGVEPEAIGSSWQNFRYLIEKFGFDRGRLISQFPKAWFRMVYEASSEMRDVERKRLEEGLARAKASKVVRSGRAFDPDATWLANAVAQQEGANPFHAIIANINPSSTTSVVTVDDADEAHPLLDAPHTWEVERVGTTLAEALAPVLRSAREVLFVDRFFDIGKVKYRETLKACLDVLHANGSKGVRCEVHYCDHPTRPDAEFVIQNAPKWLAGVLPEGMSVALFAWKERTDGADFHARYC